MKVYTDNSGDWNLSNASQKPITSRLKSDSLATGKLIVLFITYPFFLILPFLLFFNKGSQEVKNRFEQFNIETFDQVDDICKSYCL